MELKFEEKMKEMKDASPEEIAAEREAHERIASERIGAVISVVFEKAIDEPGFATSYAKMVKNLICVSWMLNI